MGLAIYALPVRAKPFQGRFRVAAKRAVGAEAMVAGESGVAASALPPQSKTRWLQPLLWDGHGRRSLFAGGIGLRPPPNWQRAANALVCGEFQ